MRFFGISKRFGKLTLARECLKNTNFLTVQVLLLAWGAAPSCQKYAVKICSRPSVEVYSPSVPLEAMSVPPNGVKNAFHRRGPGVGSFDRSENEN